MELSSEDALRLNVLLSNNPRAIRIDESRLVVYGLTETGEAKIQLNPTGKDEQYLKKVREVLSSHVTGSPGGYPVYLRRWTRMGQIRDDNLDRLLLLGEPEAVVAVACAKGLTDELARRAWWALPEPDNARRMLANPAVVAGEMGKELAAFLIDYLPFETEPETMIETLSLVLQPGLLDEEKRADLWRRAARKPAFYVGFLNAVPDDLPEGAPRTDAGRIQASMETLAEADNPWARHAIKISSASGQAFLQTVQRALKKPANQEVVTSTLDAVARYFAPLRPEGRPDLTIEALIEEAERECADEGKRDLHACLLADGSLRPLMMAMHVLSGVGYGVVRPVFRTTDAIGSLMRRKLEPVMTPLHAQLEILRRG